MGEKATVKELFRSTRAYLRKKVEVSGWVRTARDLKAFGFIEVRRDFQNLQVVVDETLPNFKETSGYQQQR